MDGRRAQAAAQEATKLGRRAAAQSSRLFVHLYLRTEMVGEGTSGHGEEAERGGRQRTDFLSVLALAEHLLPRNQRPVLPLRRQPQRTLMSVAAALRDDLHRLQGTLRTLGLVLHVLRAREFKV